MTSRPWSLPSTWDRLSDAQRKSGAFGDGRSYETFKAHAEKSLRPWVDKGLATSIDPEVVAKLNAALAANPSGKVLGGVSDAGEWHAVDPSFRVGDYAIGEDGLIRLVLTKKTWGADASAVYSRDGQLIGVDSGNWGR